MNTKNLFEKLQQEIDDCLNKGEFIKPDSAYSPAHHKIIAELTPELKAICTVHANKAEELNKANEEELESLSSSGQELHFSIGTGIGIVMSPISMDDRNGDNEYGALEHDTAKHLAKQNKITQLNAELVILTSLYSLGIFELIGPQLYSAGHEVDITANMEVYTCVQNVTLDIQSTLKATEHNLHFIQLPHDHELIPQVNELLEKLKEESMTCKIGYIPDLCTETTKTLFMPKNLNSTGMYHSLSRRQNILNQKPELKKDIQLLINSILEAGSPYEIKQHEEEISNA